MLLSDLISMHSVQILIEAAELEHEYVHFLTSTITSAVVWMGHADRERGLGLDGRPVLIVL